MSHELVVSRVRIAVLALGLALFGCTDFAHDPVATSQHDAAPDGAPASTTSFWEVRSTGLGSGGFQAGQADRVPAVTWTDPELFDRMESARASGARMRVALGGLEVSHQLSDGSDLRVQFSESLRSGSPRAFAIYVDDVLQTLHHLAYPQMGRSIAPVGMTALHLSPEGRRPFVLDHVLPKAGQGMRGRSDPSSDLDSFHLLSYPDHCAYEVIPTPECEGWGGGGSGGSCWSQQLQLGVAFTAYVAAELAFWAAVAACPVSGVMCAGALAALGVMNVAADALVAAGVALQTCLAQSGGSGGSGDPPNPPNCTTYIIEISHDGGVTWEYLGTVEVCDT